MSNEPGIENLELDYEVFYPRQKLLAEEATPSIGSYTGVDFSSDDESTEEPASEDVKEILIETPASDIDKWDYIAAACSAVLASALDILWVKDLSLDDAKEWGQDEAQKIIMSVARKRGYKGDNLDSAISKLEDIYKIPSDPLKDEFGGAKLHHLYDFSHHASPFGLCCSLITQFTNVVVGTDRTGKIKFEKVIPDELVGKTTLEKLYFGVVTWAFHLISDIAGGSGSNGWGTGIPGPLLSFFKELSAVPLFRSISVEHKGKELELHALIQKLFSGTFFAHGSKEEIIRFDLRTEMGLFHQMEKQAIPVLANECMVRGFYAIRRFCREIKEKNISSIDDLKRLDPKAFLPINNRTITRMITVSSGSFMLIVTAEAAIKAAIRKEDTDGGFVVAFLLGINYPGIVRFVFACKADAKYISEDMRNAIAKFLKKHNRERKAVDGLEYLALSENQMVILQSLQTLKVLDDIRVTKDKQQAKKKQEWYEKWNAIRNQSGNATSSVITDKSELSNAIRQEIENNSNQNWLFLVALELKLFVPYTPLSKGDRKKLAGLSLKTKFDKEQFCSIQSVVTEKDLDLLTTTYKRALSVLKHTNEKVAIGAATTIGVTALTLGMAWFFAPAIAVIIAGDAVAGLSGAALTSASLAFVGGGAIAAGGLGVAGGTAIIVGGGALVGMIGSGATSFSTMLLLSSKLDVLLECAKLMTVCKCVLIDKLNRPETVEAYADEVKKGIEKLEAEIDAIEAQIDEKREGIKELKRILKDSRESPKYLQRCYDYMMKLVGKGKTIKGKLD